MTHPVPAAVPHLSRRRPPPLDSRPLDGTGRARDTRELAPYRPRSEGGKGVELAALDDLVDDAVGLRLRGREDLVALDVGADLVEGLTRVTGQDLLHLAAHALDLGGVDLQVGDLTTG